MVKEFLINDIQKCCEILIQTFNNPPWNDKFTAETARIYLQELIDNKRFAGYTIWDNGLLVGAVFCHLRYNWRGDELSVDLIYISPEYQRKGYGGILMRTVEKYAKDHSCICISLSTNAGTPAFDFYGKIGFKEFPGKLIWLYKSI